MKDQLYQYILGIADNSLILGQRLGQLCGHGPSLEVDIACTNISLDLFGQVRSYYQYAAKLAGGDASEDSIAFLRKEREYRNVLLVEQPNTDFAYIITRGFLFDVYHELFLERLMHSKDETLAAIAAKSIKEVRYHRSFSSEWMKRMGAGTEESHRRVQDAVDSLWRYTKEFFQPTEAEKAMAEAGIGVDTSSFKATYDQHIAEVLQEATIVVPTSPYFQRGGKEGVHTEHLGYLLSDMQYMQRTYPNMNW
ncbi:phenylacetate-CoA oxygenase subunit PaaI [Lewinellaceae bacterium SD302]|nr:phenylacetate-CoA oxygenase subunit PaaI [Lewinellaceae bacterium SD302]